METKTVKPTELSALPTGPILVVLEFLSLRALSRALRVSREWQSLVDTHDHLWTAQFSVYAAGREYVVPALAELSRGERAVLQSEGAFAHDSGVVANCCRHRHLLVHAVLLQHLHLLLLLF